MKIFKKYRNSAIKRIIPADLSEKETIERWQAGFFLDIMLYIIPLSVLLYIPSLILSIRDDLWVVAAVDTIVFLFVQYLFFSSSLKLSIRKSIFTSLLYALGLVLLYYLGWSGPGLVYLFAISAFSVIIISSKAGYITFILNILVIIFFAVNSELGIINFYIENDLHHSSIITIGLNFMFFNFVLVFSISSLIKGLQQKISTELEILEQLRVESEMHKAAKEKAEESDRLKTAFLQNISHEIRTPLNGIIGFTSLLREPNLPPEEIETCNNMIYKSSYRLLDLLHNIIDLSKIETGTLEIDKRYFSIVSSFYDIHERYSSLASEKGLQLKVANNANDDLLIFNDETKLQKTLSMLIDNAIKFTNEGSIEFGFSQIDSGVRFYVKDTGIGIAEEDFDKIFERFGQIDLALNRGYEGAGVGLSICKGFVDKMGGKITVSSQIDVGTVFTIDLPCSETDII